MYDFLMGTIEGFMGTDPNGNSVMIFIDPIGFMAAYPVESCVRIGCDVSYCRCSVTTLLLCTQK